MSTVRQRMLETLKAESRVSDVVGMALFLVLFIPGGLALFASKGNVLWVVLGGLSWVCIEQWRSRSSMAWLVAGCALYLALLTFLPWDRVWAFLGYWRS